MSGLSFCLSLINLQLYPQKTPSETLLLENHMDEQLAIWQTRLIALATAEAGSDGAHDMIISIGFGRIQ